MSFMPSVVRLSGPFGLMLVLLGTVVLLLSVRAAWAAARGKGPAGSALRGQIDAILFWGGASAVLGFLGQCQGSYLALNEILAASEVSPQILAQGFVISFLPTLLGLGILAFAVVAWGALRFLPRKSPRLLVLILPWMLWSGCETRAQEGPEDLTQGVWAFEAGADVFLWEFSLDDDGAFSCLVHDVQGGLKFMETPCAAVDLDGEALTLEMPNGVRYQGRLDLDGGRLEGNLLYTDGSAREAGMEWASLADYPTLQPRAQGEVPYTYRVPQPRGDGWSVVDASEVGVDPQALEKTLEAIIEGKAGFLKSFLVLRGGALLLEEYFHGYGPDDLSPIHSCTKSVSSLLVGQAIQEGRIPGADAPLLDFFPEERAGAGSGWEDLTLEHLLTMSLALDWTPDEAENRHGTGPGAFREILARNVVGRPGLDWDYVNMNVNLLAGVVHQATGMHAEAFAEKVLFGPLGITEWDWDYGKTGGFNLMDGSLRLRPRDMAKIGATVMNGGEWQGKRVLDEGWVRRSLTPRLAAGSGGEGYGYLWWTMDVPGPDGGPLQVAFANGWGSQFILLFPELDLVVVTTGGNQENGKHLAIGQVLVQELLPGVGARTS